MLASALFVPRLVLIIYRRYNHTHWCMKSKVVMMVDVLPIEIHLFKFSFKGCADHDSINFGVYFFAFLSLK